MTWRSVSLAFLAAVFASGSAWAGALRAPLMDLLNAYDTPIAQADLDALGAGVDAELMAIADDASVPSTRRGRAVSALQYYKTDAVRTYLERHLGSDADGLVRRKAAYSLAVFGGSSVGPLTSALADKDVQLRIAAAQALGTIGGDAARKALTDRQTTEPDASVRDAIGQALRSAGGR